MSVGEEILQADEGLRGLLHAALSTPTGYAYVRVACVAACMGVSLATCWKNNGAKLLDDLEKSIELEKQKLQNTAASR